MATTVEQIARDVAASLNDVTGYLIGARWVNHRYQMICSRMRLKHLRRVGEIVVPAVYSTGTATVARNSTSVTGSGTTWSGFTGRFFRGRSGWYEIQANGGATALTLVSGFGEDSVTAGIYRIASRKVAVASTARELEFFYNRATGDRLTPKTLSELDYLAPMREETGPPQFSVHISSEPDGSGNEIPLVELYPYPTQNTVLQYSYYIQPPALALSDSIPDTINPSLLLEGAMIDAFRFHMANALAEGKVDVGAVWRNEARAQETSWNNKLEEAAFTDLGMERRTIVFEDLSYSAPTGSQGRRI